jgi:hypothetical protein
MEMLLRRRVKGNLGNLSYDVSNHHIKSTTSSSAKEKDRIRKGSLYIVSLPCLLCFELGSFHSGNYLVD